MKNLKRDNAIFEGSRLYRQAQEGSHLILNQIYSEKYPFGDAIKIISKNNSGFSVSSVKDCKDNIRTIRAYTKEVSANISPYIAVPILFQTITDYYYNRDSLKKPAWLGTALKIALAFVWKNVHARQSSDSKAITPIIDLIKATALLEQVEHAEMILEVFGEGVIDFTGDGFYSSDEQIIFAISELIETFRLRGKVFRTLTDSVQAIHSQPISALDAIENVIRGELPKNQSVFQGTIFHNIPNGPIEFWVGLWSRLRLILLSSYFRTFISEDPFGISIFQEFALIFPKGMNKNLLEKKSRELFWEKTWYEKRTSNTISEMNNMVVERPISRLSGELDLFVTAPILIADSLNWFIEESVMRYINRGGVPLPESVFKSSISEPFENRTCETFRKHYFVAGKVNDSGIWMIDRGEFGLSEIIGEDVTESVKNLKIAKHLTDKMPGEIDVLAYHPSTQEVFVIECKVLGHPYRKERIRNVVQKVGSVDNESFHSKLRKKIDWIQKTDIFSFIQVSQFVGLIVLDRKVPGMRQGEFEVLDFESLGTKLRKLYG